jgi:hypothetical protein
MRHHGGGIGHVDPAQSARYCQFGRVANPNNATEEVYSDSDDSSLMAEEEENIQPSDNIGESEDLEVVTFDNDSEYYASSGSEFNQSDD